MSYAVTHDGPPNRRRISQPALAPPVAGNAVEALERHARVAARIEIFEFSFPTGREPQCVNDRGLAGTAPANQGIERGVELEPRRLPASHVPCTTDLDGFDEVRRPREGVQRFRLIAATNREAVTVEQRQSQSFERRTGHLDPRVVRPRTTRRARTRGVVGVRTEHFGPGKSVFAVHSGPLAFGVHHLHGEQSLDVEQCRQSVAGQFPSSRGAVNVGENGNGACVEDGLHHLNGRLVRRDVTGPGFAAIPGRAKESRDVASPLVRIQHGQYVCPAVRGYLHAGK